MLIPTAPQLLERDMRYLDTGFGHPDQTLGKWLEAALAGKPSGLWLQSGYFGYESLAIHDSALRKIAAAGDPTHVVLGANEMSLTADDLKRLIDAVGGGVGASVTVISYSNALFHPKTYVIRDELGEYRAYVGSANMTGAGVGLNVEAGIGLSTAEGDDAGQIAAIRDSIESWHDRDQDGVFRIATPEDVDELVSARIVSLTASRPPRTSAKRTSATATTPNRTAGRRINLYPTAPMAPFAGATPAPPSPVPKGVSLSWSKVLQSSDAQQVSGNTNPTGKLRLSKAGHSIDHKTWFRETFFDGADWTTEMRGDKAYEVASVPFAVTVHGVDLGIKSLMIDHAPHRVADQNNVPTVLAWGHDISRILVGKSHIGDTVTLERTTDGESRLTID